MNIYSLIPDIQKLVTRKDGWFTDEIAEEFGRDVGRRIKTQFEKVTKPPELRLSKMGNSCPKALWHSIHTPHLAESLPPWAEVKFSFGHIMEALVIALAKASGHKVEGEQDEVIVDGVSGHRDCIIDGCIVDVKSSSSYGFKKFKTGTIRETDDFGYLDQLDGYLVGSLNDPLVQVKDRAYLLAIDKQLGHMVLYEHKLREERIRSRIKEAKRIISSRDIPHCNCGTVKYGESGNISLDVRASYSAYKYCCFPHLRTFIYSSGPVYLTKVVREPDVPEINKEGKFI